MITDALRRGFSITGADFRRWIAVFCVTLFVFSGVVHSMQHFDAVATNAVTEVAADSSGDGSDTPAKAATGLEHCHGCATTSLPVIEGPALPRSSTLKVPLPLAFALSGIERHFDPPPPKALT